MFTGFNSLHWSDSLANEKLCHRESGIWSVKDCIAYANTQQNNTISESEPNIWGWFNICPVTQWKGNRSKLERRRFKLSCMLFFRYIPASPTFCDLA